MIVTKSDITLEIPTWIPTKTLKSYSKRGYNFSTYAFNGRNPLNAGRYHFKTADIKGCMNIPVYEEKEPEYYDDLHQQYDSELREIIEQNAATGIPFFWAATNLIPEKCEIENTQTTEFLDYLSSFNVGNGVIVTSDRMKQFIDESHRGKLQTMASCQRIFRTKKKLTPRQRINSYRRDLGNFDYVILAPQDSKNFEIIQSIDPDSRKRLIPVLVTPCKKQCNSYWHYMNISLYNKLTSFRRMAPEKRTRLVNEFEKTKKMTQEMMSHGCRLSVTTIAAYDFLDLVKMGIRSFKIGRCEATGDQMLLDRYITYIRDIDKWVQDKSEILNTLVK